MKPNSKFWIFLILLLAGANAIHGQESDSTGGKTEIIQDPLIDTLVKKHIQINTVLNTMEGFRIQIFSESGTNSKNKAQSVHDEFQANYPGVGVYLSFKTPNYKVRVGDFRTRLDAQRFLVDLTTDYPNAFIIADQINFPKTD
jgi:hypothetical protein